MSSRYLDMVRGQRRRATGFQFTARSGLILIALIGMGASLAYWWGVQSELTDNRIVAAAFTAILTLAPPSLTSFLIPWSPAGMLLQKVNARTWGYAAVLGCALFLFYYSYQLQYSWWAAQPVVADSNLIYNQVLVGIIGFIVIPGLLWTPVSSEEMVEQVKQAHLVKRYELQTQADIAILRATLLRAQEKALIGFANLTVDEREELAGVMRGLVTGIDRTLREVGASVQAVSGAMMPFEALEDNGDVQEILDYIGESLTRTTLTPIAEETDDRRVSLRDLGIDDRSVELPPARSLRPVPDGREAAQDRLRAEGLALVAAPAPTASGRATNAAANAFPAANARIHTHSHEFAAPPAAAFANDSDELTVARRELGTAGWKRARLMTAIGVKSTKASNLIDMWRAAGIIVDIKDEPNAYRFVEVR